MLYERMFQFLFCAAVFDSGTLECQLLERIISEVERLGFQSIKARTISDAEVAIRADAAIGCVLLEWGAGHWQHATTAFVSLVRDRGLEIPLFLLVRRHRLDEIPAKVLSQVTGYVFLTERCRSLDRD